MAAVYVVRSGLSRNFFLTEPKGTCGGRRVSEAHKFTRSDAEKDCFGGRVMYRLRYKLVWFSYGQRATDYFLPVPTCAGRFDSVKEAKEARESHEYFGSNGPDDTCGWKVVPVLRRVRA